MNQRFVAPTSDQRRFASATCRAGFDILDSEFSDSEFFPNSWLLYLLTPFDYGENSEVFYDFILTH